MLFRAGMDVVTVEREKIGSVSRVVVDPREKRVSHIVVSRGMLVPEQKVIPVEQLRATEDQLILQPEVDPENLPDFEEYHFRDLTSTEASRAGFDTGWATPTYWYPPYTLAPLSYPGLGGMAAVDTERNIPSGTIPIQEGANVYSANDDHVGDIEEVMTDSDGRVTHFLIKQGLLFTNRKLIPERWVRHVEENKVYLAVGTEQLKNLPDYERDQS